ncbi:Pate8 [Phodopus roborovskii]|uniref:Pate8 protein n=1 Tax=Phodopus roborovskii TaxID=109678 RepID=A0AAU9ZTU7_PHORO|nr:Pate8 [Phodopus roborovskii]
MNSILRSGPYVQSENGIYLCWFLLLGSHCKGRVLPAAPARPSLLVGSQQGEILLTVLCVKCEFVNSSKICETQSRYCATKKGQKCLLWVATSGESLSYGAQACWEHCSNVTTMKGSLKMQLTCCDSHSLCNKL